MKCRWAVGSCLLLFPVIHSFALDDSGVGLGVPIRTNARVELTLTGEAGVSYIIESSSELKTWAPVATNSAPTITRAVALSGLGGNRFYRAARKPLPIFAGALAAATTVNLNDQSVVIDSYDSGGPNYSRFGQYDPVKAKDGGHVTTSGSALNSLNLGDAVILGQVRTGPGGTIAIGAKGSVASKSRGYSGNFGIQPGWAAQDMNVVFSECGSPVYYWDHSRARQS